MKVPLTLLFTGVTLIAAAGICAENSRNILAKHLNFSAGLIIAASIVTIVATIVKAENGD
jgi:hypothetical protein